MNEAMLCRHAPCVAHVFLNHSRAASQGDACNHNSQLPDTTFVVGYGMSFLLPEPTLEGRPSDGFDAAFAPQKCNSRVFSESTIGSWDDSTENPCRRTVPVC
jgi:hypothetical protein